MKTKDVFDFLSDQDAKAAAYEEEVRSARPVALQRELKKAIEDALAAQRSGDSDAVRANQAHVKYLRNELKKYKS